MAQNITLMGASYSDVPAVTLPKTGGGTAEFFDARSVTYNLSGGASVSADPDNAIAGQGFTVKLKAPAGYTLSNVSVTMGGVDITSTAFTPDTSGGGGGTVTITDEANATGTTCVITTGGSPEPPTPTEEWETLFDGATQLVADNPYPYFWISSLSNVTITSGSVWRVTLNGQESRINAVYYDSSYGYMIGNPLYSGGSDDGSGLKYDFFNAGWGAWTGGADTSYPTGTNLSLKVERLVQS
jgi:hypothetical protein